MQVRHTDPRDPYPAVAPTTACACLQPAPWVVVDDVRAICHALLSRYRNSPVRNRDHTPEAVNHALDVLLAIGAPR